LHADLAAFADQKTTESIPFRLVLPLGPRGSWATDSASMSYIARFKPPGGDRTLIVKP
jgi:hypothetical protein